VSRSATVLTHRRAGETAQVLRELIAAARRAHVTLRFDSKETRKHGLAPAEGLELDAPVSDDVDLCVVLGGDGSILSALRRYAGTSVPIYAVNFGEVGFLATIDPDDCGKEFDCAFNGEFELMALPAITATCNGERWTAFNDFSMHRKPGFRVADLSYAIGGDEIGRVRCDGLVVATPQGSTGYNLANGGPVLAWGVQGYVVSFIAPHTLTARAVVVAPQDALTVHNASRDDPVELHVDGRPATDLQPGTSVTVEFAASRGLLAQSAGATFYHRLRERFGRLAR
jgi:NAD+ kinase